MKQFENPPLSKMTTPLSTNPPISEQFFHDPPLCPNFKNKKPPPNFREEETMVSVSKLIKDSADSCKILKNVTFGTVCFSSQNFQVES